jgi:hypothetical protein
VVQSLRPAHSPRSSQAFPLLFSENSKVVAQAEQQ